MNQRELERLLREFGNGYITGIRADTRVPVALQAKLRLDMQGVNDAMSADLANIAETSFADDTMPSAVWERAAPMIQHGASGISSVVGENDQTFRQYLALKELERVGCKRFLYVSENGKATCGTCGSHHGKAHSMRELEALGMIPPIHQNCKCALIALDTAAETSYNLNRQKFISDAQENLGRHSGGIYRSKRNFSRGGFSFMPVKISIRPAVTDGSSDGKWYARIRDWAVDFGKDAKSFWNAFCNGFAQRDQNKLSSVTGFLDWLTAGIVSGAFAANAGRYEAAFRDPTLYNIVNFVSSGAVDTVNGAINSEKPLSFEHWMSSLETAMLAYSAYKTVEQAAALRAAPALPDKPLDIPGQESTVVSRPTWQQSELDAAVDFPNHDAQRSFIGGQEVPYGTSGSVRPDYYQPGHSVDVKNYNVTTSTGRSNLARNIESQYANRVRELPIGTKQTILIDIRGQNVTKSMLDSLRENILKRTNNGVEVIFKGK